MPASQEPVYQSNLDHADVELYEEWDNLGQRWEKATIFFWMHPFLSTALPQIPTNPLKSSSKKTNHSHEQV